jgi:hypothetical protein
MTPRPALKRIFFPWTLRLRSVGVLPFQHDGQNTCGFSEMHVKAFSQKYFSLPKSRNRRIHSPSRPHEGRFAIVTIRGAGCDGRCWRVR